MTNDVPRRRSGRRGRRGGATRRSPKTAAQIEHPATAVEEPWQWRTFPVFFAFSVGALVMAFLVLVAPSALYIFLIGAVFLTIFGVMHFFGRSLRAYREESDDEESEG
jgi:VIT1/CCC1 family predicted Fe2+/Mn2+ transporter